MKSSYHVIVFGKPEKPEEPEELKKYKSKYQFPGEIHQFEKKMERDQWLNSQGAVNHSNTFLGGKCLFQLPDGRTAAIYYGEQKAITTKISVL